VTDWQRCLIAPNVGMNKKGVVVDDTQDFTMAAATYAGRVFIFIIIVFKMAYVGIKDNDVLPYSMFTCVMATLGVVIYREAEPIQPQPQELSASLLTLTKFIRPDMYTFAPNSPMTHEGCAKAYSLNYWFLVSQYAVLVLILMVASVVFTCFFLNFRLGRRWELQLKGNSILILLMVVAFGGFITGFIAKEIVAENVLDILKVGQPLLIACALAF
jgi:hypothetical protein